MHTPSVSAALLSSSLLTLPPPGGAFSAWGTPSFTVSEGFLGYQFRYLLRFAQLHQLLPPGATILSAELTLNFINWGSSPVDVQGCFQTKPWQEVAVGPR